MSTFFPSCLVYFALCCFLPKTWHHSVLPGVHTHTLLGMFLLCFLWCAHAAHVFLLFCDDMRGQARGGRGPSHVMVCLLVVAVLPLCMCWHCVCAVVMHTNTAQLLWRGMRVVFMTTLQRCNIINHVSCIQKHSFIEQQPHTRGKKTNVMAKTHVCMGKHTHTPLFSRTED